MLKILIFCAKKFQLPKRLGVSKMQRLNTVIANTESESIAARHCEDLTESHPIDTVIASDQKSFHGHRHCEGSDSDEAIQKLTLQEGKIQKTLSMSHHTGLPRYADATLAMTPVQSMKKAINQRTAVTLNLAETQSMRSCHPELVSGSQGCGKKTRRLGFNPTSFNQRVTLNPKNYEFQGLKQCLAFSLVEMLMALLVASLLLAALAPVMTKRMDEAKINISGVGAAQYDKDSIVTIFTKSDTFNVPNDVNAIKVTMIGGGGAGGNAAFGKQEITSSGEWTVPAGITKLRVFMVGGGGSGASGGTNSGTATLSSTEATKDYFEGETKFTNLKVPTLNANCATSGLTKWKKADGTDYVTSPGSYVPLTVTACGGGGGGGGGLSTARYGGGGGSGGYLQNVTIIPTVSDIWIRVGGGGGRGGTGSSSGCAGYAGGYAAGGGGGGVYSTTCVGSLGAGGNGGIYGGAGGAGTYGTTSGNASNGLSGTIGSILATGGNGGLAYSGTYYAGNGGNGTVWGGGGGGGARRYSNNGAAGGGGGGPTTVTTSSGTNESDIIFQVGGGGGGGGLSCGSAAASGGGAGGGYGAGGGGGGGGAVAKGTGGNLSTFLSLLIGGGSGQNGSAGGISTTAAGGGFGGSGYGYTTAAKPGVGSGATTAAEGGKVDSIFGDSYCNGGTGSSGKPGKLRLWYGYPALSCNYTLPANGGGGGGAGQITIGEITVTPGEKLYFEIGAGGGSQSAYNRNGNAGNPTYIRRGGSGGAVIAAALGGNPGTYSATATSFGGNLHPVSVLGKNWTEKEFKDNLAGGAGGLKTATTGGYGGAGASSLDLKGNILQGGVGGNTAKNGTTPAANHYGAGGGGGSGAQNIGDATAGIGAAGVSGYIYLEYGGSNGGGGTAGEIVTKLITNIKAGIEIPITVGAGGKAAGTGNGEASKFGTYLTAKGGVRGQSGGMDVGANGGVTLLPADYKNYSKDKAANQNGKAATLTYGGIGGYIEALYENPDGTFAAYIKAKDGTIGGPVMGGCGGNLTTLMAGITCNDAANTPNGKNGTFGGGGGGGAVINETGGLGGNGGDGLVILEYKSVSI